MKIYLQLLILLLPLSLFGQAVSRTELWNTNDLIRQTLTNRDGLILNASTQYTDARILPAITNRNATIPFTNLAPMRQEGPLTTLGNFTNLGFSHFSSPSRFEDNIDLNGADIVQAIGNVARFATLSGNSLLVTNGSTLNTSTNSGQASFGAGVNTHGPVTNKNAAQYLTGLGGSGTAVLIDSDGLLTKGTASGSQDTNTLPVFHATNVIGDTVSSVGTAGQAGALTIYASNLIQSFTFSPKVNMASNVFRTGPNGVSDGLMRLTATGSTNETESVVPHGVGMLTNNGTGTFGWMTIPSGGSGSGSTGLVTYVAGAATNLTVDLASTSDRFELRFPTNASVIFSNAASLHGGTVVFARQDTNGTRSIPAWSVVGGIIISNGPLTFGTNANETTAWNLDLQDGTNIIVTAALNPSRYPSNNLSVAAIGAVVENGSAWIGMNSNFFRFYRKDGGTLAAPLTISPEGYLGVKQPEPESELDVLGSAQISGNLTVGQVVTASQGIAVGGGGAVLTNILTATATLNFSAQTVGAVEDLPITVTGAADGDAVEIGVPTGSITGIIGNFTGFASNNTVFIRFTSTGTAQNPASGTFRAVVKKFL